MKINTPVFCLVALIALFGFCFKELVFPVGAAEPAATRKKVCEPFTKLIVVEKGFIGTNNPTVKEFARICGITSILETKENPICCIRIEPLELDKNASGDQFIMVQSGYTLIQVTSSKALGMLNDVLRKRDFCGTNLFPRGVLSSFDSVK